MDPREANECSTAMLKFISKTGEDKINTINKQAQEEFTASRTVFINEEKERINTEYDNKIKQDKIKLMIHKSSTENNARIEKMKTVNSLIEKLYTEAKHKMVEK